MRVYIGYGTSGDAHTRSTEQNQGLSSFSPFKWKNFTLQRLKNTHAKVLIKDNEYALTSSFNWVSFKGDPRWLQNEC